MTRAYRDVRREIRRGWEWTAEQYARDRADVFARFARRLVTLLDLSPGQRVLDVGTGAGALALEVTERVGATGHVVGVDVAASMVAQMRQAAAARALHNLSAAQMDAEFLGLADASFDVVASAFSLFQFVEMGRALAEMARALRPGGQLGLSNWGPGFVTPVAGLQRDLFREYGLRPLLTNPLTFRPAPLRDRLEAAGFRAVRLIQEQVELCFRSPQEVWEWNLAMGPLPVMLETQLTAEQQRELRARYLSMLAPLVTPRGIPCTFHPLYALARKGIAGRI